MNLAEIRFDRAWVLLFLLGPIPAWLLRRTRPSSPLWLLAMGLLIVGVAGPRWGRTGRDGVAVGRDLILVIDLSRSMQAADLKEPKPRWKAAVDAAAETIRAASLRGGHRVGVVVFAAKPKLLVPPTTDFAHALQTLEELDGDARPIEIRPDETSLSGTRIGAALQLALEAHDPRYRGTQDLILVSDGDDPADDREWAAAIAPARRLGIPIHTTGIGGTEETPLLLKKRGDPEGELVSTRLRTDVLAEIAKETRGTEIPAGRDVPDMAGFFHRTLEPLPPREFNDDAVAVREDRSGVFLAAGLACFLVAWWKRPI